jgi:hypothetical protein
MATEFKNTEKFIRTYANQVESEIETRLRNNGKYASGTLYDSIRYEITEEKTRFILTFKMADYGIYVDKGTKPSKYANSEGGGTGKSKFITSLMKWCTIKGLPKNAAFPIRRHIWKVGIPPTNFFTIPTTRRLKQLEKGIEKNMALDVENIIRKELLNVSKSSKRTG